MSFDRSFDLRVSSSQLPVDSLNLGFATPEVPRKAIESPGCLTTAGFGGEVRAGIRRSPFPCARHRVLLQGSL